MKFLTDPNANSGVVGFAATWIISLRTCNPFSAHSLNVLDILKVLGIAHYILQITK